ncbi:hypothetical protein [Pseudomonas rubra]|uniref:Uncharacterized protein n=1 Tax=Pseudomonas rubra TaxID=2942627 RepID=A0ABT5P919_9PSED|nr:hypothetical protein [Pseudomonas rubra]MDD1014657.1 hypothetical protein [Pseudomonas rubra]MDD1041388.1 hypothetical protein [Pseudomonas rubra]MDD1155787.1 hypothetical protein [Pseudomonas rubra]
MSNLAKIRIVLTLSVIAGLLPVTLVFAWGVPWTYFSRTFPTTIYSFMMPNITAAAMLTVALNRQASTAMRFQSDL